MFFPSRILFWFHFPPRQPHTLADVPSDFMVLVGIMVDLCARQGVDRGRGQGNIGPVGPIGFAGLGSGLGLLFLPSLSTYTRKRKTTISRRKKK